MDSSFALQYRLRPRAAPRLHRHRVAILWRCRLSRAAAAFLFFLPFLFVGSAGAEDVVQKLLAGLDTQLGPTWPGGVEVSFGQWQKIALARGFMRDEPTAALDAETEHALSRSAATKSWSLAAASTPSFTASGRRRIGEDLTPGAAWARRG